MKSESLASKLCILTLSESPDLQKASGTHNSFMQHLGDSGEHMHPAPPALTVNKGFFYSWVTKHDPIIPTLDSKLQSPLHPTLPPVISLPPAL